MHKSNLNEKFSKDYLGDLAWQPCEEHQIRKAIFKRQTLKKQKSTFQYNHLSGLQLFHYHFIFCCHHPTMQAETSTGLRCKIT